MLCHCRLLSRVCPWFFSPESDARADGAEEAGLLQERGSSSYEDVAMQRPEAERSGMLTEEHIRNLVDSQVGSASGSRRRGPWHRGTCGPRPSSDASPPWLRPRSQLQALADLDARLGDEEEESVAGDAGRGGHSTGGGAALAAEASAASSKHGMGPSGHAVESSDSNGSLLRMERDLDAFLASVEAAEGEGAGAHSSLTTGDISLGNTPRFDLDEDEMDFGDE